MTSGLCSKRSRRARCSICIASIIRQKFARSGPPTIWMNTRISSQAAQVNFGRGSVFGTSNALRAAGTDLRSGRCYFPEDELAAVHLTPAQILSESDRFQPIYRRWTEKAKEALECGVQYSRAIRNRRVRAATALPALIGARTLTLLCEAGADALHCRIKVPRSEVRKMILSLAIHLASHKHIDATFEQAK